MSDLDHAVTVLKKMADYLMPFCKTKEDEVDLAILKQHSVTVDGYDVTIYFSKEHHVKFDADNGGEKQECDLLILQVYSKHFPFLPFRLLCKIATRFLGTQDLALSESVMLGKKLYMWSVAYDELGMPIPLPPNVKVQDCVYDDIRYHHAPASYVNPSQLLK